MDKKQKKKVFQLNIAPVDGSDGVHIETKKRMIKLRKLLTE